MSLVGVVVFAATLTITAADLASLIVVVGGGAIEPGIRAGLELPAGATVADLVAALAARGCLPQRSSPAPTRSVAAVPSTPDVSTPARDPSTPVPGLRVPCSGVSRTPVPSAMAKPAPISIRPVPVPAPMPRRPARLLAGADHGLAGGRIPQPRSGQHPARHSTWHPAGSVSHGTRPPIGADPAILGLSRITRGRVGSRLFTLFFVLVFVVIFVQMLFALLMP